jgi:hypothetical protein
MGAAINILLFLLLIELHPAWRNTHLIPLAFGAAVLLTFNYNVSKRYVFKGRPMNQIKYNGRDNLEVMQEAKNYNRFLLDLILASARSDELLVDFGAGSGTFALPVRDRGYRVTCVETDPVLSAGLSDHGLQVVSSLELLKDGTVDYIYSHYCPVKMSSNSSKHLKTHKIVTLRTVIDLKSIKIRATPPREVRTTREEARYEPRPDGIFSGNGLFAHASVPPVCGPVPWEFPGSLFYMP